MATSDSKRPSAWRIAAPLCAVGALVVAGVAGAANNSGFSDRSGDVKLAADIAGVNVSNDDTGTITIQMAFDEDALPPGLPGEQTGVALDLDQNPDTGTVYYGTEAAFALESGVGGTTLRFSRAAGSEFKPDTPPPSLHGTVDPIDRTATFTVRAADLGLAPDELWRRCDLFVHLDATLGRRPRRPKSR